MKKDPNLHNWNENGRSLFGMKTNGNRWGFLIWDTDGGFCGIFLHLLCHEVRPSLDCSWQWPFEGLVFLRWCRAAFSCKNQALFHHRHPFLIFVISCARRLTNNVQCAKFCCNNSWKYRFRDFVLACFETPISFFHNFISCNILYHFAAFLSIYTELLSSFVQHFFFFLTVADQVTRAVAVWVVKWLVVYAFGLLRGRVILIMTIHNDEFDVTNFFELVSTSQILYRN